MWPAAPAAPGAAGGTAPAPPAAPSPVWRPSRSSSSARAVVWLLGIAIWARGHRHLPDRVVPGYRTRPGHVETDPARPASAKRRQHEGDRRGTQARGQPPRQPDLRLLRLLPLGWSAPAPTATALPPLPPPPPAPAAAGEGGAEGAVPPTQIPSQIPSKSPERRHEDAHQEPGLDGQDVQLHRPVLAAPPGPRCCPHLLPHLRRAGTVRSLSDEHYTTGVPARCR